MPGGVKPHLRPLSSLTEKNIIELFRLQGLRMDKAIRANIEGRFVQIEFIYGKETNSDYFLAEKFNPQQTAYLLKERIDLFNLIPSGQAIDATTLKTQP
jgi:hypothetical protein